MGDIVKMNNGIEMEIIDHIEPIIVTRTRWDLPEHGFILEAKARIKEKDQYFFLIESDGEFAFRVCGSSYLEFYNAAYEDPEYKGYFDIIEEFLTKEEIKEEYQEVFNVLYALGKCVAGGIKVPVIEAQDTNKINGVPDVTNENLPF